MYAARIIEAKLQAFRSKHGWEPVPHTIPQIKEFTAYIESITKTESNSKNTYIQLNRRLTEQRFREIKRWIQNEQIMCSINESYFSTRYCNPPEAPIWMADYTFKPIGDIKVGDEIIGWDRTDARFTNARHTKTDSIGRKKGLTRELLKKTKVVAIARRIAPIVKITMASGSVIRCTPDHLWSCGNTNRGQTPWIKARVGWFLRKVVAVYPNNPPDERKAAWLGGLYDGEGSGHNISQDKSHNPEVHAKLVQTLSEFGMNQPRYNSGKPPKDGISGVSEHGAYILGGISACAKFVAWCRPVREKSIEKFILNFMNTDRDEIVKMELDGEDEVVSMQTETGNYVVWGYASKNCFICDEKGEIFQFKPRRSQEVFDAVVAHFEDLEVAIELFILKARQLGVSTRVALKFLHRMLFIGNTQAVMASVQADKSELIGRILNICFERCPWWLVPQRTTERVGKMMEWNNGSVLSIQSGMQGTGIAQGWTPTAIHISEVGDIPNPKKVIEEGLLRATHPTRKLFQVYEGTGNGNTGWQADYWRAIKEDFPLGRARLCPLFLSWPLATDLYPEADWLKKFPIPEDWMPCEDTKKHVRRCELYIRSTDYLAQTCGADYRMPRHQQWFWEFNYLAAVKTHTQRIWLTQMPADDYEALTGKNDLVFDQEIIEVRSRDRERGYQVYAITGNSIDDGFEVDTDNVDYDKERIVIEWDSNKGNHYEWTLVPLKPFDEHNERAALDKLLVFQPPLQGRDYSEGIDTSDGLGKEDADRCVINVTLSAKGNFPDIQVAEFASIRINPPQTVGFAAALAAWYGPKCRDPRGVKFCIEQRERPGDDCQLQLKLMGFTFQHVMIRYDNKHPKEQSGIKEGWYSNVWSVPFLMNRFIDAVNNGWYKPNSKYLIAELQDLERKISAAGKTKLEHQSGKHDDRVRAAAHAYITRHHLDILQERSTKTYAVNSGRLPEVDLSYPQSNLISVGD